MDERDFELLFTLNKTKNITHAADLLFVSQSALSKRINALEQELGVVILLRSRQGVHFTPEGEEVLKYTFEAAKQLDLMRKVLDTSRDYICGTLNSGISINYALYRLPEILAHFRTEYPHVNINITTDHSRKLYLKLLDGTIDVAIIRGEYPWKENKVLLDRENICVICSLEDKDKPLNTLPFIGRKTDVVFERELAQWMNENGLKAEHHGISVDSITTCVEMVASGLGWAVVPEICLKNFTGHIRPLSFANGEPFVRSTYLMYPDYLLSLPQVVAFTDVVKGFRNKNID